MIDARISSYDEGEQAHAHELIGGNVWEDDCVLFDWSSPKKVDMDRTDRSVSLGVFSAFGSVD